MARIAFHLAELVLDCGYCARTELVSPCASAAETSIVHCIVHTDHSLVASQLGNDPLFITEHLTSQHGRAFTSLLIFSHCSATI